MEGNSISEINLSPIYTQALWAGLKPDPLLSVSEWADQYRKLSPKASAEPGPWRTSRTPYLKEIMDALSSSSPVQEVVFMKGSQVGGTECGNNWLGYVIDCSPGPMLMVQPTVELAKRNSKQRIEPLIQESPRLKTKVRPPKSRDSGNTILSKEFIGGTLILTGANSSVGLRSMPVKHLFLDEVDAYPGDVDGEGDPVVLAKARTRTFSRRKILQVSTPTIQNRSRIEASYLESDQRKYYLPCPHCKGYQTLKWAQIKWSKGKPFEAVYHCDLCREPIEERFKSWMLEQGEWRAENPPSLASNTSTPHKVGFHLSALYSPVGWFSWGEAASLWEESQNNPEKLRVFINTVLGETWKDKGEAPDWKRLYERREEYPFNTVPKQGLFLTAGVDVQRDRIECEIVAWGRKKRSWSVDYRVLPGDTSSTEVWDRLEQVLNETFLHTCGLSLPIRMMAVDSGFNTQQVYSWCRKFPIQRVMAIKGYAERSLTVGQPKATEVTFQGKRYRRGLKVWPIGTSVIKSELYGFLRQSGPGEGEEEPYGFCHFPQYGEEFFKQLTSEELMVKIVKGYRRYEWQKRYERNEALDCRVYARAAAVVCGMDRWEEAQWERLEKELGIKVPVPNPSIAPTSVLPKPKVSPVPRRKSTFWN